MLFAILKSSRFYFGIINKKPVIFECNKNNRQIYYYLKKIAIIYMICQTTSITSSEFGAWSKRLFNFEFLKFHVSVA